MVIHNYKDEREQIRRFLLEFQVSKAGGSSHLKYVDLMICLANRDSETIFIDLDDVLECNEVLCESILKNTKRYALMFSDCVQKLIPQFKTKEQISKSPIDIFIEHRKIAQQLLLKSHGNVPSQDPQNDYPPELLRHFDLYFHNLSSSKAVSVRAIMADCIGRLVTFKGIVTRSSEVKPLVTIAAYVCDRCGAETFQKITSPSFIPLEKCCSKECVNNKFNGRLHLQTRGSKFVKHQELKIQELSDQVPAGHVPRYSTVVVSGDLTRIAMPGNHVTITGIFLPMAKKGFKQILSGLLTDTYVEAHSILVTAKPDVDDSDEDDLDRDRIKSILSEPDLYEKLAGSIAPEIYGHEDIKKALLLLMAGGVDQSPTGLRIRGNINILLVGDPGMAKSQLLSYIDRSSPRCQMTTGKGSSGVGLTAAVLRDPSSGEMVLEGGALVLADRGICCIDEFDKMDDSDRTAIHEVMEQQTVSIAKAGVSTTLNARVSILAAANPAYGRYNPKKTIEQNIQLSAALLSRFDLIWVIRDHPNRETDLRLAQHITHVHKFKTHPQSNYSPFSIKTLRGYIKACKKINPYIPEELKEFIVSSYVNMRRESRGDTDCTFTSARTLLSILRLSAALARLRMSDTVLKEDVQEAIRLMDSSKASVGNADHGTRFARPHDVIFGIIRDLSVTGNTKTIDFEEVKNQCLQRGFNIEQLNKCLSDYEELNVLHISSNKEKILMI